MKRTLLIAIDSGIDTCASTPGVFCPHMRTGIKGVFMCQVFDKELRDEVGQLSGETGWLRRLPECMESER